jgi:hypothetical protein
MSNQTTIALKNSGSTGNTPIVTNLAYGELAINYADGKLFYRTVSDTLGSYSLVVPGVNKDVIFNDSGVFGVSAGITFDKSSANLAVTNMVTTADLNLNNQTNITVGQYTTANTNQVVVDSFPITTYRTAKYTMQITYGSSYHSEEITVIHNGSTPRIVEYGVIYTNGSLGSFDVDINLSGNLELLFTPITSPSTLKFTKTSIAI